MTGGSVGLAGCAEHPSLPASELDAWSCLDGLRGPIAAVEALRLCGVVIDPRRGLADALQALPNKQWPADLMAPSTMADIHVILDAMIDASARARLHVCHPFNGGEEPGDDGFRFCLASMLEATATICALIRLSRPAGHWIIGRFSEGLVRYDDPYDRIHRSGYGSLWETPARHNGWIAHRDDVVLFQDLELATSI